MANRRSASILAAIPGLALFVVVSVGLSFALPIYIAILTGIVIGAALYAVVIKSATKSVLSALGARELGAGELPGVENLVDGLSASVGVRKPDIWIVDDPRIDCAAVGTSEETAVLVVTAGLADRLDRIQQEAVLARGLARIKGADFFPATVSSFLTGRARKRGSNGSTSSAGWSGRGAEMVDFDAVRITRYPPALIEALESQIKDGGFALLAEPGATFDQRIQILHEF